MESSPERRANPCRSRRSSSPIPGPGEAVVAIQACGVCHTDLHYREGGINDDFPFLLGHEAAGVVESVGDGVTDVAPGDYVILNWRAVCGDCRACLRGQPWYCFNTHNATQKMTLTDGTVLSPALGIGAFVREDARRRRAVHQGRPGGAGHRGRPARLRRDGRPRRGDQHRRRHPRRVGRRVRLRRRRRRRHRRRRASPARRRSSPSTSTTASSSGRRSSAPPTPATRRPTDPVEFIRSVTGGFGADVCIEAIGHPDGVQAGVRGPRPRRHRRARRRAATRR